MTINSKILLLLDFDGTLSPIVSNPNKATLPARTKQWLKSLLKEKHIKTAIVTGRALPDIQRRVGLKGLIYAANHGLEICNDGQTLLSKGKKFLRPIAAIEARVRRELSTVPGIIIEMKGTSLSIHYRMVKSTALQKHVITQTKRLLRGQLRKNGLQLTAGKKVLEVRPQLFWNKGKAALWIWRHLAPNALPIYVGDDTTDEDAFSALRPYGITILIGRPRKTAARYRMLTFTPQALSRYFR